MRLALTAIDEDDVVAIGLVVVDGEVGVGMARRPFVSFLIVKPLPVFIVMPMAKERNVSALVLVPVLEGVLSNRFDGGLDECVRDVGDAVKMAALRDALRGPERGLDN